MAYALDLGTGAQSTNGAVNKGDSANSETVLASCLAFLVEKSPDLADVLTAWPKLPEALKAGILAMVKATVGGENCRETNGEKRTGKGEQA